jgi:hypothetical protein
MSLTMALPKALKLNDELKAELNNKDKLIKKLMISLLEEEVKNEKLSNKLQQLQDLEEWCDHRVGELQENCQFFYSCACISLGTAFLVIMFKKIE